MLPGLGNTRQSWKWGYHTENRETNINECKMDAFLFLCCTALPVFHVFSFLDYWWSTSSTKFLKKSVRETLDIWKYLSYISLTNSLPTSAILSWKLFSLWILKALLHCLLLSRVTSKKHDQSDSRFFWVINFFLCSLQDTPCI